MNRLPVLSPLDWFCLALAGFSLIACLVLSVRQMLPSYRPTTRQARLRHALLGGLLTSGFLLSLLAIGYILDKEVQWSLRDLVLIFLCFVFPFQVIATVGLYVGFLQQDWMRRQLTRIVQKSQERREEKKD